MVILVHPIHGNHPCHGTHHEHEGRIQTERLVPPAAIPSVLTVYQALPAATPLAAASITFRFDLQALKGDCAKGAKLNPTSL